MSGLFGDSKTAPLSRVENRMSAISVQTSTQGIPIPIVYGTTRVSVNNIWYGNFTAVPHTTSQTTGGGKTGTQTVTTTSWTYTVGLNQAIAEGPIQGIGQAWSNKDETDPTRLGFTLFSGARTGQAAWGWMSTNYPDMALTYNGTAYLAHDAFDLGGSNYLPNLSFEVQGLLYPTGGGLVSTWATLDSAMKNNNIALSADKLTATVTAVNIRSVVKANVFKSTGKWYCEFGARIGGPTSYSAFGLATTTKEDLYDNANLGQNDGYGYYPSASYENSFGLHNSQFVDAGANIAPAVVVGMYWDAGAGTLGFTLDGVDQGVLWTGVTGTYAPALLLACYPDSISCTVNFGASAWAFAPPVEVPPYVGWSGTNIQFDVTPAQVLNDPAGATYSLLPNEAFGAAFPTARLAALTDFHAYCVASGILVSPAYVAQEQASSIVERLCKIGNAAPFWSEGQLKITPYADTTITANGATFTPNTTINYDLTDDDFIHEAGEDPVRVRRKRTADAFNVVSISCKNRANSYNVQVVDVRDQAHIDKYGVRPMPVLTFSEICNPDIAQLVGQTVLKRGIYYPNEYEFTVGWKYSRLEPMDLVSLTDDGLGMVLFPVRITEVVEDDDGNLAIKAEDFLSGTANPTAYNTQGTSSAGLNRSSPPGDCSTPIVFQPSLALSTTPQIWLGTSPVFKSNMSAPDWGGCEVWMSADNVTYQKVGQTTASATMGVLSAALASNGTDPDVTNTLSVNLLTSHGALSTVPQEQADALVTLCYVDGECLAFQTATLTSAYNYDLTYLRRGKYWTNNAAHLISTSFMFLNSAIAKIDASGLCAEVGTTIYFKLLSFNSAGANLQSLADVTAHTYVLQPLGMMVVNGSVPDIIPSCQNLYVPADYTFVKAGRLTIHGRVTLAGRLRMTN